MIENKVTIHIISEKKDITKIAGQLTGQSVVYYHVSSVKVEDPDLVKGDIVVFYITSLNPPMFQQVVEARKYVSNQLIFLVENKNPVVASKLAKLGFNEIYILPDELFKFGSFLAEQNKSFSEEQTTHSAFTAKERDLVFRSILGESPDTEKLLAAAKTASENSSVNVLILGETGTGKGMLANAIHNFGSKKNSPFVEVTCSAIPEPLLESELFGYEKGAFTDAKSRKLGLFELANNGTIFLDEIGELSLNLQVKLLRVLEKKIIRRLGGTRDIPVNARIISATHRNLSQLIGRNLFRTDLFYRLNVITIELAALRKRHDFILSLVNVFIKEFSECYNKKIKSIDQEALNFLSSYRWPGNIRELRNAFERAVLLCDNGILTIAHFENIITPKEVAEVPVETIVKPPQEQDDPDEVKFTIAYQETNLQKFSLLYIHEVLKKVGGNKSTAAKLLGISRPRLDRLLAGETIQ